MDRNSIIGIALICAIMFAWMWYSAPSEQEIAKKKAQDSIALVQEQQAKDAVGNRQSAIGSQTAEVNAVTQKDSLSKTDSAKTALLINKFDVFAAAAQDTETFYTVENDLMVATVSSKGGRICSVQLKEYRTHDSRPLYLFDKDSSAFGILFDTENNRTISTTELFFKPADQKSDTASVLAMRLYANADSTGRSGRYIEYQYTLEKGSYLLGYKINVVGMEDIIASNLNEFSLNWAMKTPTQERDIATERQNSTAYFKYLEEDADYLSETSDETKMLEAKVKWVSFKQQFFTSVLIADSHFEKTGADLTSTNETSSSKYVKNFAANLTIPYAHKPSESFAMRFYFGPNHFQTLKKFDLNMEKQIPLGWGIFGWVNKFLVIPVFNFLDSFNLNYAIIILCLTLVFKTLLFPVAYKTYVSSAKMRILKPEIDELNAKYGNDDPMKKQQATMALYKKAGVSPLAGCIPALLQMPILLALFRFFPASIELRQQGFWWATDLSTYDSVWNFGKLPVIDFIYGDHVSVWALLCTITTLIYTHLNSQMMSNPSQQQMPGMKYMIYLMPIMFLPFLNKFSAGLSYYYTLANIISFGQMFVIRYFVDEKKLHAQIEEFKKRPAKAASGFQQKLQKRLEEAQRQRSGGAQRKGK